MRADVKALQVFIDQMVGIEKFSYPARQNGAKKPADKFAHIRLLEEYQESIPAQKFFSETDTEITYRTYSLAKLRFRVGVVDTDGIPSIKIMHGWTSEAIKQLMISSGYGFISCKPLSNEDAKLEKEWEPRIGFSVELYVTRILEEVVSTIDSVEISSEFITPQLDVILDTYIINNTN